MHMFHFTLHFFLLGGKMQHITKKEPLVLLMYHTIYVMCYQLIKLFINTFI